MEASRFGEFLRAGLVHRLTITRVPVLIGEAFLFGTLPHDIRLRHLATRQFPSGLVSSEYEVADLISQTHVSFRQVRLSLRVCLSRCANLL